jgi:hypothetical protein
MNDKYNMAPLQVECTKEQQQYVTGIFWCEGVKSNENYERVTFQYHDKYMHSKVQEWVETLRKEGGQMP